MYVIFKIIFSIAMYVFYVFIIINITFSCNKMFQIFFRFSVLYVFNVLFQVSLNLILNYFIYCFFILTSCLLCMSNIKSVCIDINSTNITFEYFQSISFTV
uniref:Uncharacterized protein n=1 Tax=Cacopsylla melanoneura TaxID=428564 RepID=A0A8D8WQB8_9HEMI